jgi:hypothetical protein
MHPTVKARIEAIREELDEFEHPLNDQVYWLIGVTEALVLIAELSSEGRPEELDFEEFDA